MALTEADVRAIAADEWIRERAAIGQQAAPPIAIGELTDVPAPGAPIASKWAQEATYRIVHRFATIAERDQKYPPNAAGAGAVCSVAGILYTSNGTSWQGRQRIPGNILNPGGPGPAGEIIPGTPIGIPFANMTIPYAGRVRLDITVFLSGTAQWSGQFWIRVATVNTVLIAASAASVTTLDVHPVVTIAAPNTLVDIVAGYGAAGTGTGNWTWFPDVTTAQFSAELGQP